MIEDSPRGGQQESDGRWCLFELPRTVSTLLGGAPINIPTGAPDRDFVELGVGVGAQLTDSLSMYVNYDTIVGNSLLETHAIRGGVRLRF